MVEHYPRNSIHFHYLQLCLILTYASNYKQKYILKLSIDLDTDNLFMP